MKYMMLVLLLGLAGCKYPPPVYQYDKETQRELFLVCLSTVPAGPTQVVSNDWAEVVSQCKYAAMEMSERCVRNCPAWEKAQ